MHRIDTPTAQKDKFGAGKNGFTRGNPQTGTPATDLDDDYFDMLQEELAGVVEASGASLDKLKHNQLLTAIKAILLTRSSPFADIKSDGNVPVALENLGLTTGGNVGRLIDIKPLSGTGIYTRPANLKYALVYVVGAGGGSGSAPATSSAQTSASPGGASGSWAKVRLTAAEIGASLPYVVGPGGAAGVNGAGGDGGNTSFGSLIVCPGGKGSPVGIAISTSASAMNPGAAAGGIPTVTAGIVLESSNGNPGGKSMFVTSNTLAGDGGSCPKGAGGQGQGATAPASPGSGNGGGASGATNGTNTASSKNGAPGANGGIWVMEFA